MLWNFNSLAQLLQGGPGFTLGNAVRCGGMIGLRSQQRIFVKADEMRLDALDASLEMFIRPELIFAKYESWFYDALYDISSDRHILNGFSLQVFVCVASATTRSPVPYCSLVSWQVETPSSSLVTLGFRGRQMWPSVSLQWYCLGLQNGRKKSWFLRMKLGTSSQNLRGMKCSFFSISLMVLSCFEIWNWEEKNVSSEVNELCCFQGYASTEQPSNCSSDLRWFDVWRCLICLLSHDCLMNVWESV